jgi:hypothetical protein
LRILERFDLLGGPGAGVGAGGGAIFCCGGGACAKPIGSALEGSILPIGCSIRDEALADTGGAGYELVDGCDIQAACDEAAAADCGSKGAWNIL